ncbi:MAG: NADH:ubiquinone reductase (Na(+)-transporting) subunit F [Desulfobacterales bacterium]|nr:NADH:ubiquinone reductase (Na(+)-transporting) subunit F [Desulfobacterales bacterium]
MFVFSGIIGLLVAVLLVIEATIMKKGFHQIVINNDESSAVKVPGGLTLLAALVSKGILLPSACGGGGSCGMCRCVVNEGGGKVLPTELAHLSRKEKNNNVRLACQLKVKENLKIKIPEEIFSIKKYKATTVSNRNVATFIKELVLKLDQGQTLDFQAGAYIQIDIPKYDVTYSNFEIDSRYIDTWKRFDLFKLRSISKKPEYRAYSLANPPSEKDRLMFTIRIATPPPKSKEIPPGIGSSYIFNLKQGDRVTLSGPYGEFFVKNTPREMCFIGGGAGMAPMRCHILHQLDTLHTQRKMTFWYGARSKQEVFYDDQFTSMDQKYSNFSFYIALSEPLPEDNWTGMKGFIHQCLYDHYLSKHQDPTEIEYYLCGPPQMIDAVISLLDSLGVDSHMIAYDKF